MTFDHTALVEFALRLPGAVRDVDFSSQVPRVGVLGDFLSGFVTIHGDESPVAMLVRCPNDVADGLVASGRATETERRSWGGETWRFVDVDPARFAEDELRDLVATSHRIVVGEMPEPFRLAVDLIARDATPSQTLDALIEAFEIGVATDYLRRRLTDSVELRSCPSDTSDGDDLVTAVGGRPDGGPIGRWPVDSQDRPMTFVAQVDLAEHERVRGPSTLPAAGRLQVFVAIDPDEVEPTNFLPATYDGTIEVAVRFAAEHDDGVECAATPDGALEFGRPRARLVRRARIDLPYGEWDEVEIPEHPDEAEAIVELAEVFDAVAGYDRDNAARHRILGRPQLQQDLHDAVDPDVMVLLFQLGSDDAAGMPLGDDGSIQVWIREDSLAAGDFTEVMGTLDCG